MKWLDRRIAAPGPFLCLCLTEAEYKKAMKHCNPPAISPWLNFGADATTHVLRNAENKACCVVCLNVAPERTAVEIAGLLIHEAVHVWQEYADAIGEKHPGIEQEAYAIQSISQELLQAYADSLERGNEQPT